MTIKTIEARHSGGAFFEVQVTLSVQADSVADAVAKVARELEATR